MKRATCTLLATFMLLGIAMQPALGDDGYEPWTYYEVGNEVKPLGDYFLRFGIANGSKYVNVSLSGPSVPSEFNEPKQVWAGHYAEYPGMLRVYVDRVEGDKAYVLVSRFSRQDSTAASGTKVSCDVPGQTALGGDVVSFPILIQNNNPSDHTYSLSSFSDIGWKTWFEYGDKGVYKISVPARQSRTVNLMVQTWGNTPVGEKKVVAYVDDIRLEVFVDITSANQSADVSFKVGSKIASIGDKITYDLRIRNVQAKENIYSLSVAGLPDNWYARFKESATSVEELAEVVIPASSDKDLVLEVVPPYSVSAGSYNFTAVVTTPEGVSIKKYLTLTLKSGVGMSVTSSRLAYETKAGQAFDIVVYVSNAGQGTALTNVYIEATAPQGWLIKASPNRTNSIKAGETQTFTLTVQPPGNIVASDYEVNVKVKSDQAEKEKDYRVTVKADSYVPYLGAGILIIVIAGLAIMYKRYGRR
ncbi:NEW3 domain-containing protein [Methanocella conradii]|uniref:COG1470 family protein n=1 Tax=Methanocella conradii TaxID=1175444 RepID=UPI0024B359C2|nr:NEW3 domain-containing protein [Methanocella conradii]MDI6896422.1 NEW3 domain-containing protein [Methanocella conradii]